MAKPCTPHPIAQRVQLFELQTGNVRGRGGRPPRLSLGISKGVFSLEREYPFWLAAASRAASPLRATRGSLCFCAVVRNDNSSVRLGADGERCHTRRILERSVDDVALVGVHGLEGDIAAVLRHLAGDLFRQALEALLALFAVIFCVDLHAGTVLLAAAVDAVVRQLLDGVERFAAAADQRAELFTFEEDLVAALLTLVDLDLSGGVHVRP